MTASLTTKYLCTYVCTDNQQPKGTTMDLKTMHPEKVRRLKRYGRERKNFRLTNFSIYKLKLMAEHYKTTETAIIEAAIQLLSGAYIQDQIESVMKCPSENKAIEVGRRNQAIADNLGI